MAYKTLKRTRKFLGKTEGFENKEEKSFEKAHLKAYLKGHKTFQQGFELDAKGVPITHRVQQEVSTRK